MSSFTERLERDFGEIAAQAAPSPTGWARIQQRIEQQPDEPATEVVLLSFDQGPASGRRPSTTVRRGWLAAATVLIIVVGVALVQTATGSDKTAVVNQPSDGSTAATTTPPSPESSRAWSMGAAGPGTFTTTVLQPGLVVTIGDGWIPDEAETEDSWSARLPRRDRPAASQASVAVLKVDAGSPDEVIETASSRGFRLSEPEEVEVGGRAGQRYDVTGGALFFLTSSSGDDEFRIHSPREAWRISVLEVAAQVVLVAEYAPRESSTAIAAARGRTEQIIATIEWLDL